MAQCDSSDIPSPISIYRFHGWMKRLLKSQWGDLAWWNRSRTTVRELEPPELKFGYLHKWKNWIRLYHRAFLALTFHTSIPVIWTAKTVWLSFGHQSLDDYPLDLVSAVPIYHRMGFTEMHQKLTALKGIMVGTFLPWGVICKECTFLIVFL